MSTPTDPTPQRTPLYDEHLALGARMAPFGGFDMPIQYAGILAEHQACRGGVVVFDTCHMGEFEVSGAGAAAWLDRMVSCHVASLRVGRCRYGLMLNEQGGVIDDLIVYRLADERFMLVVNAGTRGGDAAWFRSECPEGVAFEDASERIAKLDVQGPKSAAVLCGLVEGAFAELPYFAFSTVSVGGQDILISRTGYTGELGYELYVPSSLAASLWRDLIGAGVVPAGLGARDTLRLEVGMPLYGHELSRERNAASFAMARVLASDKCYIGSEAVASAGGGEQQVALLLEGRRTAREGDAVMCGERECGVVTSGSYGPSVGCAIALAYVKSEFCCDEAELAVRTARAQLPARRGAVPFYVSGTARMAVADVVKSTRM